MPKVFMWFFMDYLRQKRLWDGLFRMILNNKAPSLLKREAISGKAKMGHSFFPAIGLLCAKPMNLIGWRFSIQVRYWA